MFVPAPFKTTQDDALEAIRIAPFATLITTLQDEPIATHLPMSLSEDSSCLLGHFAKVNPHWQAIADGQQVLTIFQGGDHYVSPSWYPSKKLTGKVVPTWNYISVHVSGTASLLHDADSKVHLLQELTSLMESHRSDPWAVSDAPDDYVGKMLNGIVGIRIEITSVQGKHKLSQNKDSGDKNGVKAGLLAEATEQARKIAEKL